MKKRTKVMISVCLVIVLLIGIGSYAYASDYYHADETVLTVMSQADPVQIERDGSVTWFVPEMPVVGLIFYPGGKVEHTAYAPLLYACAEKGILCALIEMPGNVPGRDFRVNLPESIRCIGVQHGQIADRVF